MNLRSPMTISFKILFHILMKYRRLLPKKKSVIFGSSYNDVDLKIGNIYLINLDRQVDRLINMKQELTMILDSFGQNLWGITERFSAIDAKQFLRDPQADENISPHYTLKDQLFVEPQPQTLPTNFDLNSPILMSRPEIAIAQSHIEVWKKILSDKFEYALVLEDDVWFKPKFVSLLDQVWSEITTHFNHDRTFDILYLSYDEVKNGAPKIFISKNVFRPIRGLWYLSGYVISKNGAEKLLSLLPCRGPIDLWINHQFKFLEVLAIRKPIICQRRDINSTNLYSILPTLTKIGAINNVGASLFHIRPTERPVFAFGTEKSGLSSLAMALSMMGYRCCSDLDKIPKTELELLLEKSENRIFDAYVNIGDLETRIKVLTELYPRAKFFLTKNESDENCDKFIELIRCFGNKDIEIIDFQIFDKWQIVSKHLKCAPPTCSYPQLSDLGQRELSNEVEDSKFGLKCKNKRDASPWVIEQNQRWNGIHVINKKMDVEYNKYTFNFTDNFKCIDKNYWILREDTFTDNLALFRSANIKFYKNNGISLKVLSEPLGIRRYSSGALTSSNSFLYGRFDALIKTSKIPGVVTGIFLHRNSPRQEIDIEITGNQTNRMLVNVFYNPGCEDAKFDYGYRGAPSSIELDFDASEDYHQYSIIWKENEILWIVDNQIVHKRVEWNPTPIPHLPMSFHVNIWPTKSKELAGRVRKRRFPAETFIKSITINANKSHNL